GGVGGGGGGGGVVGEGGGGGQGEVAVEDDDRRHAGDADAVGQLLAEVLEDREGHVAVVGVGRHLVEVFLLVGVGGQELHLLAAVLLFQGDQAGQVEVGDRAVGAEEGDHDRLVALEVVQRPRGAAQVAERVALGHLVADGDGLGRLRGAGRPAGAEKERERQQTNQRSTTGHVLGLSNSGMETGRQRPASGLPPRCPIILGNARACFGVTVPQVYSPAASLDFFGPAREAVLQGELTR